MSSEYSAAKGVTEALIKPLQDIIEKISGPAAEEVGLMIQDHVKVYRFKRQVRLLQRTKEFLNDAGLGIHSVPPKILLPIMDYASVEGDDELQDLWAALLANAASEASAITVLPAFLEVLKQLSACEVQFLSRTYDEVLEDEARIQKSGAIVATGSRITITARLRKDLNQLTDVMIGNLERLGLIELIEPTSLLRVKLEPDNFAYDEVLTPFARAFVIACRAPVRASTT